MTLPTGRLQFFALEAEDYIERLAAVAGRATPPDADEFVRLARALRGAALMAGLSAFSQAASGLEQVAKAFRDGRWAWAPPAPARIAAAVDQLRALARQATAWTEADTRAATAVGAELVGALIGEAPAPVAPAPRGGDDLAPGVRDFVAREGALVAGSLEHAAQAVELGPIDQAADLVLRRLQPLRGLAALPALAPLPEFLDAIELTLRAARDQAPPPGAAATLREVAAAVGHLARDIAGRGRADADAPGPAAAAARLLGTFGSEDDVVDVQSLFADDDGRPIVRVGTPPVADRPADATIELVGLGDRLRQTAGQLATAPSATSRHLLLFGLLMELRPLAREARTERPFLAPFLGAVTGALGSGAAARDAATFAACLRDGADVVTRAAEYRNAVFLADELAPVTGALRALAAPPAPAPPPAAAPEAEPLPVPIETLAPEPDGFERTLSTLAALERAAAPSPQPDPDRDVVPIEALLYRGRPALERADAVRLELSRALAGGSTFDEVQPLVSELIDLVPLALAE
jgi:HPt (histidine-containing phosphotransfer) domain-containing protein